MQNNQFYIQSGDVISTVLVQLVEQFGRVYTKDVVQELTVVSVEFTAQRELPLHRQSFAQWRFSRDNGEYSR